MISLGNWEDHLADITCDAVIVDPPYDGATHKGAAMSSKDGSVRDEIAYEAWTPKHVRLFVESWQPRCRGWFAAMTSSGLIGAWRAAYRRVGLYAFAPVPCVISGMTVRITGDGPSSWAVYLMVARPSTKKFATWGTLPGAYVVPRHHSSEGGRGKPPWLMNAIVRDYSRPDDLVIDPLCGYGSTGVAALSLGRRFLGAERDPAVHAEAVKAIARPQQTDLFAAAR